MESQQRTLKEKVLLWLIANGCSSTTCKETLSEQAPTDDYYIACIYTK